MRRLGQPLVDEETKVAPWTRRLGWAPWMRRPGLPSIDEETRMPPMLKEARVAPHSCLRKQGWPHIHAEARMQGAPMDESARVAPNG